jgi:hypothetical protein
MSLRLFTWAMAQQAIPSPEKFVLMAMAEGSDDADNVWHGTMDGICRFTNLAPLDALEVANSLIDRGLVSRVGRDLVLMAPIYEPSPIPAKSENYFKKKPIPKVTRMLVMHRDNHECQHCGAGHDLTIDHIHPESKGGTNDIENLQVLCRRCNCSKGVKVPA